MWNQLKFNSKKNITDLRFWVFIINYDWMLTPSSIISIVNFEPAFV